MHGSASTTCDRCESEMKTNMGSTYSQWMSKKMDETQDLHCQECRSNLADPTQRTTAVAIDLDEDADAAEFKVILYNATEESVGFALQPPGEPDDQQWNDDEAWGAATAECEGLIGILTVTDETDTIVFEHVLRGWFNHREHIASSQMLVGGESEKTFTITWEYPDTREIPEIDQYLGGPSSAPTEHAQLTAHFDLYAQPRGEWPEQTATTTLKLR